MNGESDGSKKRKRQMKTPFQQEMLEKAYAVEMYPVKDTIEKLSETLGLTDSQLQVWFLKRRLKDDKVGNAKTAGGGGGVGIGSSRSSSRLHCKDMNQKTMVKPGVLNFEVGQLAETKTFETGFRAAWFKCKIKDISLKENKILPEYYDFLDEEIKWEKIYDMPPYGRSKKTEKQLMVRPQYPQLYHKSEMLPVSSISEVCVIINGAWKIGDLVDWYDVDCYWSASITKILSDDMVKIELPKPPTGQGKVYKVFCKDLRPSLEWSPSKGWTLPTVRRTSCSAQLIFPSPQDFERAKVASPLNASSTSRISVISSVAPIEEPLQSQEMKIDGDDVEKASSSDSISTIHVEESKTDDAAWENVDHTIIDLNIMHEETLEASILDLEELANKIKWLRGILESNQSRSGSWKFAEHSSPQELDTIV